ncbi:hypothetical protein ACWEWP_32110 [Streptomyces olivaceus]
MGFGSFYVHFPYKEALFDAASGETMEWSGSFVDSLTEGLAGMDAFAHGIRLTCRLQRAQPEMVRLILNFGASALLRDDELVVRLRRDLEQSAKDGSFAGWNPDRALMAVGGAVLRTLQILAADPQLDDGEVADEPCLHLLQMLGVRGDIATARAHAPLPKLAWLIQRRVGSMPMAPLHPLLYGPDLLSIFDAIIRTWRPHGSLARSVATPALRATPTAIHGSSADRRIGCARDVHGGQHAS